MPVQPLAIWALHDDDGVAETEQGPQEPVTARCDPPESSAHVE